MLDYLYDKKLEQMRKNTKDEDKNDEKVSNRNKNNWSKVDVKINSTQDKAKSNKAIIVIQPKNKKERQNMELLREKTKDRLDRIAEMKKTE